MTSDKEDMKTQRKASGTRFILLTSWASVATALFVMVLLGGAIYISERCDIADNSDIKELHVKDGDEKEDIVLDNKQKTQLVVRKDKDGKILLISTKDYNRKLSATYLARSDLCLLSGGQSMNWYETWNVTEVTEIDHDKEVESHYEEPDFDNHVTDLSLVPEIMRPFCTGKQIYWTKEREDAGDKNHHKRAAAASGSCCHTHGCGCWCCHHFKEVR